MEIICFIPSKIGADAYGLQLYLISALFAYIISTQFCTLENEKLRLKEDEMEAHGYVTKIFVIIL